MNPLTNLFLQRRGYTPEVLKNINDPSHQKLLNIDKLSEILKQVHDSGDRIVIMPDFDTDGISAGTVGMAGLAQMGFNVSLYAPVPANGYGIQVSDVRKVQQNWPDVKYIITCDVGITCYNAFEYAKNQGIHVLITDHHEEKINKPKPLYCDVIVDPCQLADTYPLKGICGAHVFYQVLMNYAQHYENDTNIHLISLLSTFAGIGTIGDMMPVVHENRPLIVEAVKMMRFLYNTPDTDDLFPPYAHDIYKRAFIGLKVLMQEFHRNGKLRSSLDIDEKWLGWTLVPTYNSAKRLNLSMKDVFGIFFGSDTNMQAKCSEILIQANEKRKRLTKQYFGIIQQQTEQQKQPWAPFIFLTDADGGFAGLIANMIMNQTGLPAFVLNAMTLHGSGRTPDYLPIIQMTQNSVFAKDFNGHEHAFGVGFSSPNEVSAFYSYLEPIVAKLASVYAEQHKDDLGYDVLLGSRGAQKFDQAINLNQDFDFLNTTKQLKPFGQAFPEPVVNITGVTENARIMTMGKLNQHLKIVLPEGISLISWNNGDKIDRIKSKPTFEFSGNLAVNEFRGSQNLQLIGDWLENKQIFSKKIV